MTVPKRYGWHRHPLSTDETAGTREAFCQGHGWQVAGTRIQASCLQRHLLSPVFCLQGQQTLTEPEFCAWRCAFHVSSHARREGRGGVSALGSARWHVTRPTLQLAINVRGTSIFTLTLQDRIGRPPIHLSHSALTRPHTKGLTGGSSKSPGWQNRPSPIPSMGRDINRNLIVSPTETLWCCHCYSKVRTSWRALECEQAILTQETDAKEIEWSGATQEGDGGALGGCAGPSRLPCVNMHQGNWPRCLGSS